MNVPAPPPPPHPSRSEKGRTRMGVLLRVAIFALTEMFGLSLIGLLYPVGGYFIAAAIGTFAAAAVANTIALRVYERARLADVGLGWSAASRTNLLIGLGCGMGGALLVLAPPLVLGLAEFRPAEDWSPSLPSVILLIVVLLFGAIGEELLFRGYGFQLLLGSVGTWATILPMAVLFGAAHSTNQNATQLGIVNTGIWGILFGVAFLRSRDLWLPIGIHYGWNVTLPLFGVNLSGFTMKVTGYSLEWKIPDLWSGGAYGPEAGLLNTVVLGVLFYAMWKAPVRRQVSFLYQPDDDEAVAARE